MNISAAQSAKTAQVPVTPRDVSPPLSSAGETVSRPRPWASSDEIVTEAELETNFSLLEVRVRALDQRIEVIRNENYALQEQLQMRDAEIRNLTDQLATHNRLTDQPINRGRFVHSQTLEEKIQSLDQQIQVVQSENRTFQEQLQIRDAEIHTQKMQLATLALSLMPHDEKVSFAKDLAKMYMEGDLNSELLAKAGRFFPHNFLEDATQHILQAFELGQKIDGNVVIIMLQNGKLPLIVDVDRLVAASNAEQAKPLIRSRTNTAELQARETAIELLTRSGLPTNLMQIGKALRMIKSRLAGFIFTDLGGRQTQPKAFPDNHDGLLEIEVITRTQGLLIYCQNILVYSGDNKLITPTSPIRLRTPTSPSVGKVEPAEYVMGAKTGGNPINWFDGEFLIRLPPDQEAPIDMSTLI